MKIPGATAERAQIVKPNHIWSPRPRIDVGKERRIGRHSDDIGIALHAREECCLEQRCVKVIPLLALFVASVLACKDLRTFAVVVVVACATCEEPLVIAIEVFINEVYTKFGFKYTVELSTRPEDSMGSDEDWEAATNGLKSALEMLGLPYTINEGDGAFYGPKIDFHLEDTLGRTWQCGTVQLDFQMPQNFELEYTDENNEKKRPIMVHRVCYGSIERFIGILTEHFAGKFPVWLAPVQAKVLLVSDKVADYGREVYEALRAAGIRTELDDRNEKIGYMIREAQVVGRVPYMLVIGQKEAEEGNISIRNRDTTETETMSLAAFIEKIKAEIRDRV